MANICFFDIPPLDDFHGHHIEHIDPRPYFEGNARGSLHDLLMHGWNRYSKTRSLVSGSGIDHLYRTKDPSYMRFLDEFVARYRDYDLIVMSHNIIHPEILHRELSKPVKILGLIDDPYATYDRSICYMWAFDGAFYISPSYDQDSLFPDALKRFGCKHFYWLPITPRCWTYPQEDDTFYSNRDIELIYVGKMSHSKVDRLVRLKEHFGPRFKVYGKWPLHGYGGFVRWVYGGKPFPHRVATVTEEEKVSLYARARCGINFEESEIPAETGNRRFYEMPAYGAMMVCQKAAMDAHATILEPDREAVFYDDINDAIAKIEYYLAHEKERIEIARNGCRRVRRDYHWPSTLKRFIDWALSLKDIRRGQAETTLTDMSPVIRL